MSMEETQRGVSRRTLLKYFSASAAGLLGRQVMALPPAASGRRFAYVGTYTGGGGDAAGNGKGIYLYEMDAATGGLKLVELAATSRNPSFLAFDPAQRYLFAGNEISDFGGSGRKSGSVSAFAVSRADGKLQPLNVVSSEGAGPAHVSVDAQGKYVLVANYGGGTAAVLPIGPNGSLGPAVYTHKDEGSLGPGHPTTGATDNFDASGHDGPHAHMIAVAPGNRFAVYTDLGQDRIYVSAFDAASGKLSPLASQPFVGIPPGDGPRHFVFDRSGRRMFLLAEESSTVISYRFDPNTGALHEQQTISTLPPGFAGTNYTAEILLSPDERFLYISNRLHDTVSILAIDAQGRMHFAGEAPTMGDYPRHIQLSPEGTFLYSCNQRSDSITCFRVNRQTGKLTFTGKYIAAGSPACIVFLK